MENETKQKGEMRRETIRKEPKDNLFQCLQIPLVPFLAFKCMMK